MILIHSNLKIITKIHRLPLIIIKMNKYKKIIKVVFQNNVPIIFKIFSHFLLKTELIKD
jgi:hypothetical protein